MKTFQLVNSQDGTRSEFFVSESLRDVAMQLEAQAVNNPRLLECYVLLVAEKGPDGGVFFSRAPMVKVSTFISKFIEI